MAIQVRVGSVENRYALTRLAAKAKADGIRLFRDRTGRYFASSASQPGTLHYVTGYSCDCQGFVAHGRCKHHAALMTALGWVEGAPEPTPPTETCAECGGLGTVASPRSRWVGGSKLGYRSEWTVQVACPVCGPADVAA